MNTRILSSLPLKLLVAALALFISNTACASVVISSTRIIYPQRDKEVTVRLESKNQAPVLVQVWLDDGDEYSTPDLAGIPFVLTPPIFRLEPGKQQVVRLAYTGASVPAAQESLFWFNLLEVPAQSPGAQQGNQLQLAFRSRIKLLLRPSDLPHGIEGAAKKLQWRAVSTGPHQALEVYNPSPYYVTFEQIEVQVGGQRHARGTAGSSAANMVMPGGRNRFELPSLKTLLSSGTTVEFQTLDDFGVKVPHTAKVLP